MIVLFTDFGLSGPYLGQMTAVLHLEAPGVPVVNLFADAPSRAPKPAAYLLAAHATGFPPGSIFLAVVDPGVGGARAAAILEADGCWYVGPENGLLAIVARRASRYRWWQIRPDGRPVSATFHGRDIFAPAAAALARGEAPARPQEPGQALLRPGWPDELAEIIYIDGYGNALTGLRAESLGPAATLSAAGHEFRRARSFSDVAPGQAFWFENANGLAEIAVNLGSAAEVLGLQLGSPVFEGPLQGD